MYPSRPVRYFFSYPDPKDEQLYQIVSRTLQQLGFEALLQEQLEGPKSYITAMILDALNSTDFVIADVTGSASNVMYEVGYAQGQRKRVLPIIHNSEKYIADNLAGYQYLVYNPAEPQILQQQLERWATLHFAEKQRV